MPLLVPNSAEALGLEIFLGKTAPGSLSLSLYTNSWSPEDAMSVNSLVEMGAVGGYAQKNMVASSWSVVAGAPTRGTFPQQSFIFTASAGPVHGYFIKDTAGGGLRWAEQFAGGPSTITASGDTINVTTVIDFRKSGE